MKVAVPRETREGERRVALTPDCVKRLTAKGIEVSVESRAGEPAGFPNAEYEAAGAVIEKDRARLLRAAQVVCLVQLPDPAEIEMLPEGSVLVGLLAPYAHLEELRSLAARSITAFSLELLPRITRAQSMDALSSMSTIAGYRSVLVAATALPKMFPMLMTAAGTVRPAKVLVLGAGVAGLQAIATARRLGAVVEAYDIRAAAKEQVESLGARFVEDPELAEDAEDAGGYAREQSDEAQARQRRLLGAHLAEADVVICTALVPGKRAPLLVDQEQVRLMRPGTVVIDLAADQGGNCALSRPGEVVMERGVEIHGPSNVPSSIPFHASQLYARNLLNYVLHLAPEAELKIDLDDELTAGPLITHAGRITNEALAAEAQAP
ncbi:MAG: Re/Si-specific NAD(P)(+) transhydrogenase subunit alpha [Myxococcales bacterium]|nr:Re/Si-specific NAD(P)(+) transhydrogenase subunit alpha [Myxococcales bacterium]